MLATDHPIPKTNSAWSVGVFVLVASLSSLYVYHYLDRGWWPNNAGAFSLGAVRVLDGQIPHKDFDEIYTGGANYYHALSFKLFGTKLTSARRGLFLVFLLWLPSVYFVASRFAAPGIAGLTTMLAATWSLPIYADPITSWYNLFLATICLAMMARYLETKHARWLFLAGVCGGLSCLMKIIGVYLLAGIGVAILFWEQLDEPKEKTRKHSFSLYSAVVIGCLWACLMALIALVGRHHGFNGVSQFVTPVAVVVAFLTWNEFRKSRSKSSVRFRHLFRLALPVSGGVAIAIIPYLLPYLLTGSLGDLLHGLFVSPQQRFSVTSNPPPAFPLATILAIVVSAKFWRWSQTVTYCIALLLTLASVWLLLNGGKSLIYATVISIIRSLTPSVVIVGLIRLFQQLRNPSWGSSSLNDNEFAPQQVERELGETGLDRIRLLFALLGVTSLCALVQFPQADTIYIFFIAPLGALTVVGVFGRRQQITQPVLAVFLIGLLLFTTVWINTSLHYSVPYPPYVPDDQTETLDLERSGGIRIHSEDEMTYEELIPLVQKLSKGKYIFATPDCPEIYFLTGLKNPTRITYDFFDDPIGRDERIIKILEEKEVNVVVLNRLPQYSKFVTPEFQDYLGAHYSQSHQVGNFVVLWNP